MLKFKETESKKKKMKNEIYNKTIFLVEIILSLLLGLLIYKIAYKYQDFGKISKSNLVFTIITSIFLIIIIVINLNKYKNKIEKLFVTFIIPIGILFMILIPLNYSPDENSQMFRCYDISVGNFITPFGEKNEGDIYVPKQMKEYFIDVGEIKINQDSNQSKNAFSNLHKALQQETNYKETSAVQSIMKTYCPVNYLPSAFIFWICRIFNIKIVIACYLVRLINLLLFTLVGYYCIKIVPFGKLIFAMYMFLPMIIQQAVSISADAFLNALSLLFIAYNLKLLYQKENINFKQRLLYYIMISGISLAKYIYFPLVFLSLLFIKKKNITKKNKIKLIIISIIVSVFLAIGWYMFSQKYVDGRTLIIQNNVKPVEQIKYILKDPLNFSRILFKTLENNGTNYILTFVGSNLSLLDANIPIIYILGMLYGLLLLPFFEKNEIAYKKCQKLIVNMIAFIVIILVITGLYITWTGVGDNKISGVQGRYFIPVFILFLLTLVKEKKYIEIKNLSVKYFFIYFILNIMTLISVGKYFI